MARSECHAEEENENENENDDTADFDDEGSSVVFGGFSNAIVLGDLVEILKVVHNYHYNIVIMVIMLQLVSSK